MMRIFVIMAALLSHLAQAEVTYEIDISECMGRDYCAGLYAGDMYEPGYVNEKQLKILAWFDIVKFEHQDEKRFFPLFNVFNFTSSPFRIELTMQLLGSDKDVLASRSYSYDVVPYSGDGEPNNESFISMNAVPFRKEDISKVSFVRVSHSMK